MDIIQGFLGIGVEPKNLTLAHVAMRGVVVFVAAIVMVRLGDKRFLSRKTAFDAILGFILASMLARAVNGSGAFWPTIGGGFALVALHRLIALASRHAHWFGELVKGSSDLIIRDGKLNDTAMKRNHFSSRDLEEDLRLRGVEQPEEVRLAYVERNGDISVIKRKPGRD